MEAQLARTGEGVEVRGLSYVRSPLRVLSPQAVEPLLEEESDLSSARLYQEFLQMKGERAVLQRKIFVEPPQLPPRAVRGRITALDGYIRRNRNPDADEGAGVSLLVEDGTGVVHILLPQLDKESAPDPHQYLGQLVTVHGAVYDRAGLSGLTVNAIEPLAAAPEEPPAEPAPSR